MSNRIGRSVSIIGVGYSPIGSVTKTPPILDFTERELFAWAALEAMEDANITGKDIEAFYVAQVGPAKLAHQASMSATFADWIGMRYKPNMSHDEGCTSANGGLHQAVMAVASGVYDVVLSGGTGVNQGKSFWGLPSHIRVDYDDLWAVMNTVSGDPAYLNPGCAMLNPLDAAAISYAKENHLTVEQITRAMASAAINARHNAVNNPKALFHFGMDTYEEEAKKAGFADVYDCFSPENNPLAGAVSRFKFMSPVSDGASALIVCETEKAKKMVKHPIEIIGIGGACATAHQQVGYPWAPEIQAFQKAYKMAGINDPYRELEYMGIHDCNAQHYFTVTETAGYFRKGEAWKAVLEGRIAYDGDKPVNTSGGRLALGHPLGGAAGIEIAEAVHQMRGDNGVRQMPKPPHTSLVQSFGAGFHVHATVLRTL